MTLEVERRLRKAEDFVAKAFRIDVEDAPEAVVHLAYYAMYHAAVAALIEAHGEAPKKHGRVIAEYGRLVKDQGEARKDTGRAFNRAYDTRRIVDYDVSPGDLAADARELREAARTFVELCQP